MEFCSIEAEEYLGIVWELRDNFVYYCTFLYCDVTCIVRPITSRSILVVCMRSTMGEYIAILFGLLADQMRSQEENRSTIIHLIIKEEIAIDYCKCSH